MTRRMVVSLSLFSLALVAGCRNASLFPTERSMPLAVDSAPLIAVESAPSSYPLDLGNHWDYTRTFSTSWVDDTGPHEFHQTSAIERELVCETPLGGHSYAAEQTLEFAPNGTYTTWTYYRQDRFGLYEADDHSRPPCASSAAGIRVASRAGRLSGVGESGRLPEDAGLRDAVAELEQRLALVRYSLGLPAPSLRRPRPAAGEIVRLAYPLHTGQSWIIRADPRFTSVVEGVDVLRLPAGRFVAYRIRIDSELFRPNDRVRVWYSGEGFLQLDAHLEGEGVDPYGNLYTVASEDRERLEAIALAPPSRD